MMVADLLKLTSGQHLTHASGLTAKVVSPAAPSRIHGWRVRAQSETGICWITPANASDWRLDTK
jgi:hypothetical protein